MLMPPMGNNIFSLNFFLLISMFLLLFKSFIISPTVVPKRKKGKNNIRGSRLKSLYKMCYNTPWRFYWFWNGTKRAYRNWLISQIEKPMIILIFFETLNKGQNISEENAAVIKRNHVQIHDKFFIVIAIAKLYIIAIINRKEARR